MATTPRGYALLPFDYSRPLLLEDLLINAPHPITYVPYIDWCER